MAQTKDGALKCAAVKINVPIEEYLRRLSDHQKWCTGCKDWHCRSAFRSDETRGDGLASVCNNGRRIARVGKGRVGRPHPLKERARGLIAARVKRGTLANPNLLACSDCGHIGADCRHEYDHYCGYDPDNAARVQVVCAKCHRRRERERRMAA